MSQLDEKQLGKRLQKARQTAGLTQQELCHRAKLSYSTLAKIERGAIRTPSIFTIQSIAAALGTTLDELVGMPVPGQRRAVSRSGVRFVYFDVNNCLVSSTHAAFPRIAAECGLPSDVVETIFWRYNDMACRGELTLAELNAELAKHLKLPNFDWTRYYFAEQESTAGIADFVGWVREHYGVGLLTNSMPGLVPQMIEMKLLPAVQYDAIIDSSEAHHIKPEREIYELAQARAGCAPHEILLTDDSRANLMAAEKLGWHVMLFDDSRPAESIARVKAALELS